MKRTMLSLLALALVALPAAAQRETAEASWDEGKVTISYGSPKWRANFGEMMAKEKSWRLGANEPTSIKLTCGLITDDGAIPAGDYKLAMRKNDKNQWDLVVYQGDGFYNDKVRSWGIRSAMANGKADTAEALSINLEKKALQVRFGPHDVVYPFKPVKMHKEVETDFARIKTTVNAMAVPCEGKVDGLACGSASIFPRGSKVTWNMALTIDGDTCSMTFTNGRAKSIAGEQAAIKETVAGIKKRMENADDAMKQRAEAFIKRQEEAIKKLDDEARAMARYRPSHTIKGKVAKRDTPASTLAFESERIEGGIILTFGAGDKTATFDVNPREFFAPRR